MPLNHLPKKKKRRKPNLRRNGLLLLCMPETILITGGTGLIGKNLSQQLVNDGHTVIVLTRNKSLISASFALQKINYSYWNVDENYIDEKAFAQANTLIHLAGENVAGKRWTAKRKKEILESRVSPGKILVSYLQNNPHQIKTIIAASAIGWYKPKINPNLNYQEDDTANTDFLGQTCQLWEQSLLPAKDLGIRLITLRIGIVLSKNGGALKEFLAPLKFGIAAIMGKGNQFISWISLLDLCNIIQFGINHKSIEGVFNAVSPTPETNKNFVLQLAKHCRGKWFLPIHVPSILLKIMLGGLSIEVLKSSNISCQKIIDAGFTFNHSSLKKSFNYLLPKATP